MIGDRRGDHQFGNSTIETGQVWEHRKNKRRVLIYELHNPKSTTGMFTPYLKWVVTNEAQPDGPGTGLAHQDRWHQRYRLLAAPGSEYEKRTAIRT